MQVTQALLNTVAYCGLAVIHALSLQLATPTLLGYYYVDWLPLLCSVVPIGFELWLPLLVLSPTKIYSKTTTNYTRKQTERI